MSDYRRYNPGELERPQIQQLLMGSIVPRPIGWTSTRSRAGVDNLAPFSFFSMVCAVPPTVSLTIARKPDGSEKHSLKNIRETREFCVNVATRPNWEKVVDSGSGIPEEQSEFEFAGLTPIQAERVNTPRVKESPIHLECRLERILELGPNRHPVVFGEVLLFHVDPAVMTGELIDMKKLQPMGHLNANFYTELGNILERDFER